MSEKKLQVTATIAAPPEQVFALLADRPSTRSWTARACYAGWSPARAP